VHSAYLAESLARQGHDVTLFYIWHKARDPQAGPNFFRKLSVQSYCVVYKGREKTVNINAVKGMVNALAVELPNDFDIYHVHDAIGAAAVQKVKGRKGKLVWTIHHLDSYNDKELDRFFENQLPKADGYATVSKYWQKELKQRHGLDSDLTYSGIDTATYNPKADASKWNRAFKFKKDKKAVLFVGGLEPRKGLEHMLLIMEIVHKEFPNAKLLVLGKGAVSSTKGEAEMINALLERTRTKDRVFFVQDVPENDMPGLYAMPDMVVLPSRTEGWGLSLHQGMAAGKPVAAFAVGGVPELVTSEAGFLAPYGDAYSLAQGIIKVFKSRSLARKMGKAARERAVQFDWDRSAREAERLYKKVM